MTSNEFEVLVHLARYRGKVIDHGDLLTTVWGAAHMNDTQHLRVSSGS